MQKNEYLVAKIGLDTAENEPRWLALEVPLVSDVARRALRAPFASQQVAAERGSEFCQFCQFCQCCQFCQLKLLFVVRCLFVYLVIVSPRFFKQR